MTPHRSFMRLLRSETVGLLLEFLAAFLLLAEACLLLGYRDDLSAPLQAVLWVQWSGTIIGLYALGFFHLLNPVLAQDLVRAVRRRRHFILRSAYVAVLLIVLVWVLQAEGFGFAVPVHRMPEVAEVLFVGFVSVQLVALILLTPAYTAGAVAEEKERRTLDFLLTSCLSDRDIILGKLFSRVVHLGLILFAGLPILSLLQLVGGIDPHLLLASFAVSALTLLSLGTLSVFNSVVFSKPRAAVFITYVAVAAYLILSGLASASDIPSPWTAHVFGAGNPFILVVDLETQLHGGSLVEDVLPPLLRDCALFHLSLTAVLCLWATARMRPIAERDAHARPRRTPLVMRLASLVGVRWRRPAIGDRPMLWKEVFTEPGLRLHWVGKALLGLFVIGSFVPPVLILDDLPGILNNPERLGWAMNAWVRSVGTLVASLLLLRVAVHAAGSVNGEHHRDTMTSLLTTPLEPREILFAKWVGSILGTWRGLTWLSAIWLLGVLTGGVHPLAVPLLALAYLAYAAFVSALGLWYSTVFRSSLTASFWTVFTVLLLWTAHWLLFVLFAMLSWRSFTNGNETGTLVAFFHLFVLTPPANLAFLPFTWWEVDWVFGNSTDRWMGWMAFGFSVLGPLLWTAAGWLVWSLAERRLRQEANRDPVSGKESVHPV